MKYMLIVLVLFVLGWLSWRALRGTPNLRVGEPAPQFELADQQGAQQALSAYRDGWLILYFYQRTTRLAARAKPVIFATTLRTCRQ